MDLLTAFPELKRWDFKILATDIDTAVLHKAARGIYPESELSGLTPERARLFKRVGDGTVRMPSEARQLIAFKPLNLIGPWPMKGPFDAIFCRNVAIYFDKPTQGRSVRALQRHAGARRRSSISAIRKIWARDRRWVPAGRQDHLSMQLSPPRNEKRMSIKVLVVDDSALIREVLTRILTRDGDIDRGGHRRSIRSMHARRSRI